MKKIVVVIFGLFLFAQNVYCGQNYSGHDQSSIQRTENDLSFEANDFYSYLTGNLPAAQVFFNIIPERPNSFSSSEKTKLLIWETIHSRNKINFNLSLYEVSVFCRYSSAVVQIFLKTACFRL
jgi:hypothetical protein